jgi:hypothetical protein
VEADQDAGRVGDVAALAYAGQGERGDDDLAAVFLDQDRGGGDGDSDSSSEQQRPGPDATGNYDCRAGFGV